jgi:predicted TIM-barrel fold metal-dependent hydrolase
MASLIWEGVFERYPDMKIVVTEYGWTWVPALMWRMDAGWRAARSSSPWVKKAPSEYVREHFRFTSQPADECPTAEWVSVILDQIAADQTMLFATDYPHWDADEPDVVFRGVDPERHERIYWQNAVETFGSRLRLPAATRA